MADDAFSPLTPADEAALRTLQTTNEWLRAVLCTLARRGVALRRRDAARAQALLDSLAPWPLYKGGQFLFDLMEWEDFMLDGPPPPLLPTVFDAETSRELANLLNAVRRLFDGNTDPETMLRWVPVGDRYEGADKALPPLEPGFYLYQDVVLGLYESGVGVGLDRSDSG